MSNYYLGTKFELKVLRGQNLGNELVTMNIPIDIHVGPNLSDLIGYGFVRPEDVQPFDKVVATLQWIMDNYPNMVVRGLSTELFIDDTGSYSEVTVESHRSFFAYDKTVKLLIYKEPLRCIDSPDHYHFQKHIMFLRGLFNKLNAPEKNKFTYNGDGIVDMYEVENND